MNIFFLDRNLDLCVQYHCDKHIVKMPIEMAQILSTCNHKIGLPAPYKSTHKNHPCVKWTFSSTKNYAYILDLGYALCQEYTYRYGKKHKTLNALNVLRDNHFTYISQWLSRPSALIEMFNYNEKFPQCMPEDCKVKDNAIAAYRNYYKKHKQHILKWTKRDIPEWILKDE